MADLLNNILTTAELAHQLKRSPETLERWRRERRGPPYLRLAGKGVLYDKSAVEAWLQAQSVQLGATQ
jgi:predicted DNA-binding transcriptional regulator AlpA